METQKIRKIGVIVAVAALAATAGLVFIPKSHPPVKFTIEQGETLSEITKSLTEKKLIINRYVFSFFVKISGNEKKFMAGKYNLPANTSISELISIFKNGKYITNGVLVTIPEGTNSADIVKRFKDLKFKDLNILEFQKNEGYLFPDSYLFNDQNQNLNNQTEEIINKMKENFNDKTKSLLGHLSSSKIREIIIIASILEKEVRNETDMKLVAGIINNRLKKNMPLEIDATVAYGVCLKSWQLNKYCDVTQANLVDNIPIDSEYNTYRRTGLPIGPISNPGLMAIKAVMNPTASSYFYYLSAKDGTTIYSKTYQEHVMNRRKYLGK